MIPAVAAPDLDVLPALAQLPEEGARVQFRPGEQQLGTPDFGDRLQVGADSASYVLFVPLHMVIAQDPYLGLLKQHGGNQDAFLHQPAVQDFAGGHRADDPGVREAGLQGTGDLTGIAVLGQAAVDVDQQAVIDALLPLLTDLFRLRGGCSVLLHFHQDLFHLYRPFPLQRCVPLSQAAGAAL